MPTGMINYFMRLKKYRPDACSATLSVLEDPKTNRKVYLVGTTNSSSRLAYRTQKLIEEVKPESVFVQTSEKWWSAAKHV